MAIVELLETMVRFSLDQCEGRALPIEQLVLSHGKVMTAIPTEQTGVKRECFKNAALMAFDDPSLTYVEGVAIGTYIPFPIHHAWCIDAEGNVIDNTWDNPEECEYMGIAFPTRYLRKKIYEKGYYGILSGEFRLNEDVVEDVRAGKFL